MGVGYAWTWVRRCIRLHCYSLDIRHYIYIFNAVGWKPLCNGDIGGVLILDLDGCHMCRYHQAL